LPPSVASPPRRTPRFAAFVGLLGAVGLASSLACEPSARADDAPSLEGAYSQGPLHEMFTVQQWITACGPAPNSSSSGGGGAITVTQDGKELVFAGGGRTFRTDQCYDPLPTLHVDVHTRDPGGTSWRNHCATAPSDPRRATIQSLVTVNGPREIDVSETGRYEITLQEGTCIADIRRSRSFTRVAAPPSTPTPQAPVPRVAPVDTASLCAHPGLPASLEIRPAHHTVRAGDVLMFTATVRDGAGCAVSTAGTVPHFKLLGDDGGKIIIDDKGTLTVAADAAETTTKVEVTAAGTTADADLTIISGTHYDELLANGGLDAGNDDAQVTTVVAPSELGGEAIRAKDASQRRRAWFVVIIGAFSLALGILALIFQRRTRKAAVMERLALARHQERVRDIENRRGHQRQAHAEQLAAHQDSVERARKASAEAKAEADARAEAEARAADENPTTRIAPMLTVEALDVAESATATVGIAPSQLPPAEAALVCTTCLRDFPPRGSREGGGGVFCPFDATLLTVARPGPHAAGSICPTCQRGYPPGVRVCAVDGDELAPAPLVRAPEATSRGKICPTCGSRFEGAAAFCGKDGTLLVLLN
jgi:hypothetical protein